MKVIEYILSTLKKQKMHMTLLDPARQTAARSAEIADIADRLGTNAFMVGGSTGVTQENLDETVKKIKSAAPSKPVIYFPAGARAISRFCDAIYFMSLLNSRNVKNVAGEQVAAAPAIKKLGIEPIPMGYVIVEPGMKVGEVGDVQLLRRDDIETARAYAIATENFGMKLLYLEAGSGADKPVPADMVRAVKEEINIPLVVGGGIRDGSIASSLVDAGADIIVTGTLVEKENFETKLSEILDAIR